MTKFKFYTLITIVALTVSVMSYVSYVFSDRKEAKEIIVKQEVEIQTKETEKMTTAIAAKALGKIEQINKEVKNEASTSVGTHTFTF